jgi:hypothetical protein
MNFEDKPPPGRGYLLLIHLLNTIPLITIVSVLLFATERNAIVWFTLGHGLLIMGLIYWMLLHAAYNTSYKLDGIKLEARSGIFKTVLRASQIGEVTRVKNISRVLGWGIGSRGFCNRFRDGVLLNTGKEKIFISPSHPDLFIEQLKSILPNLTQEQPSSSGGSP